MCFSATASFSAALVLALIGLLALRAVKQRAYYALALVPLLFAVQQAAEGMVWLTNGAQPGWVYLYLFFVLMVWPAWVPLSVWMIETDKKRSYALLGCCVAGLLAVAAYGFELLRSGATATVGDHISYYFTIPMHVPVFFGLAGYLLLVTGSCCISSKRLINFFGVLAFAAALLTIMVWKIWFTSVWCFFGAVISCSVYGIVRFYNKK